MPSECGKNLNPVEFVGRTPLVFMSEEFSDDWEFDDDVKPDIIIDNKE